MTILSRLTSDILKIQEMIRSIRIVWSNRNWKFLCFNVIKSIGVLSKEVVVLRFVLTSDLCCGFLLAKDWISREPS